MRAIAGILLVTVTVFLMSAACFGAGSKGQLPLGGDRECSNSPDISLYACGNHDNCYWAGGTELDRHVCDAEFLADLMLDGVSYEIAWVYYRTVHRFGGGSFTYTKIRTRGIPR